MVQSTNIKVTHLQQTGAHDHFQIKIDGLKKIKTYPRSMDYTVEDVKQDLIY